MVDDKFEIDHANILAELKKITNQPVKYVINTHHHGDHSGDNAKLQAMGAQVVTSWQARQHMVDGKQPGLSNITFDGKASLHLGGKRVDLFYFGRAHTNGDIVALFPAQRVLAAGDMFTVGDATPQLVDYPGGGSAKEWPQTVDGVLGLDFDQVVPGHGTVAHQGRPAEVPRQRGAAADARARHDRREEVEGRDRQDADGPSSTSPTSTSTRRSTGCSLSCGSRSGVFAREALHHVALSVTDMDRATWFYGDVLGPAEDRAPAVRLRRRVVSARRSHSCTSSCIRRPGRCAHSMEIGPRDGHLALRVRDRQEVLDRLQAHGVEDARPARQPDAVGAGLLLRPRRQRHRVQRRTRVVGRSSRGRVGAAFRRPILYGLPARAAVGGVLRRRRFHRRLRVAPRADVQRRHDLAAGRPPEPAARAAAARAGVAASAPTIAWGAASGIAGGFGVGAAVPRARHRHDGRGGADHVGVRGRHSRCSPAFCAATSCRRSCWRGIALAVVAIVLLGQESAHPDHPAPRPPQYGLPSGMWHALASGVAIGFFFLLLANARPEAGLWPLVAARRRGHSVLCRHRRRHRRVVPAAARPGVAGHRRRRARHAGQRAVSAGHPVRQPGRGGDARVALSRQHGAARARGAARTSEPAAGGWNGGRAGGGALDRGRWI